MVPYQDFINLLYIGPGETTEHEGDDGSLNRTVTEVKDFQNQYGDIRCRNRRPTAAFTKQHSQVFVQKTGRTCGTFRAPIATYTGKSKLVISKLQLLM